MFSCCSSFVSRFLLLVNARSCFFFTRCFIFPVFIFTVFEIYYLELQRSSLFRDACLCLLVSSISLVLCGKSLSRLVSLFCFPEREKEKKLSCLMKFEWKIQLHQNVTYVLTASVHQSNFQCEHCDSLFRHAAKNK